MADRPRDSVTRPVASYQEAGVSIEAGETAVALMREAIARTAGPEVVE